MNRRKFLESGALVGSTALMVPMAPVANTQSKTTARNKLWMVLSNLDNPDIPLVIPSLAWIAKEAGATLECYLEAQRDGRLFARTGSTVLGGNHHQQFNYLNAIYEVEYIILGEAPLFRSSIDVFQKKIIAESDSVTELYNNVLAAAKIKFKGDAIFSSGNNELKLEFAPYLYPEIYFRKALAFPPSEAAAVKQKFAPRAAMSLFLSSGDKEQSLAVFPGLQEIDSLKNGDDYKTISLRIAERWKQSAKALAFGDPAAILSQLAKLCREDRISVYGKKDQLHPSKVQVTGYTEAVSSAADDVIRLASEIGNKVIVGRQTGDGDLFHWSKGGVCIQIMDPNRPAFPVVESIPHVWVKTGKSVYEDEPDDAELEQFAEQGKVLGTLMWHSGEMAHNEAMLNLFDIVNFSGIKMGIGVHAARYETAPQLWELLNIPRKSGGVKGFIEPVLHSGGMGVLAEVNCPPADLASHCRESLARIKAIAGDEASPKGYYAFMDSDYGTLSNLSPRIYDVVANQGLDYFISSASPGRNAILYERGNFKVLNQTPRVICSASPFVRITTVEDLRETGTLSPGWLIGTLDAPVISFDDYIWNHGTRFMQIVKHMTESNRIVNVTPHTIYRYAEILKKKGYMPA